MRDTNLKDQSFSGLLGDLLDISAAGTSGSDVALLDRRWGRWGCDVAMTTSTAIAQ